MNTPRWIPIGERSPEPLDTVLLLDERTGARGFGELRNGVVSFREFNSDVDVTPTPTHWMGFADLPGPDGDKA